MTILTYQQMQAALRTAGFSPGDAVIGSAIGMAESSGRSDAINYVPCVGFMQINAKAHPEYSVAQLENPQINAQAAYKVYKAQGWAAWTTYTSGAYKRYMSAANRAVLPGGPHADTKAGAAGRAAGQTISDTVNNFAAINTLAGRLNDPKMWERVGMIIIGIVLILMGIVSASASSKNLKLAANIAKVAA